MNQHTPGPWTVYIHKNGGDWDYQIRTVKPHNPAGVLGKHVASPNKYLPEIEANARLIAAAPDLLAALKDAMPELERAATAEARSNLAPTGLSAKSAARDRRDAARAAIAKAVQS